jgi:hypothetical protein
MKLQRVQSSAIEAVGYDADRRWLEIRWVGQARVYRYYGVPAEVYQELREAESLGTYVNEQVKPRYLYEQVAMSK